MHWLVSRKCASLLEHHRDIDKLHAGTQQRRRISMACCKLRAERFDIAIDFQGLLKSRFLAWLSGTPRRLKLLFHGLPGKAGLRLLQ
jgi:ADP-heptose:LPS heptosyltransferase